MTIRELLVRIGFVTDKASMQNAQTSVKRLRDSLEETGEKGKKAGEKASSGLQQIGNVSAAEAGLNRVQSEMHQVEDSARRAGQQGERSMQQIGDAAQSAGGKIKKINDAASSMSRDMAVGGAAITAPMAGAVVTAANFEYAMKRVQAATKATGDEYNELSAEAQRLGATTQFSASQAAEGMYYLGLAGWDKDKIIKAMPGMLDLAAAGDMGLGPTADIVSDTMQAFGIDGSKAGHVADVFAATITSTNTDIQKLGDSMKYIAPIAHQAGMSLEETSAMAGLMANEAVKASMSGTSLRSGLLRLAGPPKMAAKALESLGVKATDASGNLKRPLQLITELSQAMAGMGNAEKLEKMKKIFGEEAATGWATLLDQGPEKLQTLTTSLENADGAAERIRKIKLDSLIGQWTIFKSSLEGAAIAVGMKFLPSIQDLVSRIGVMMSKFKQWVDENPVLTQGIFLIISGLGVLLTVMGTLGVILTSIVGFFLSLSTIWATVGPMLAAAGTAISGSFSAVIAPILGVVAAIGAIGYAIYDLYQWINGGDSVFGAWFDTWDNFKAGISEFAEPLIRSFEMIIAAAGEFWQQLMDAFPQAGSQIGELISALRPVAWFVFNVIGGILYGIVRAISWVIEQFMALMTAGGYIADAISTLFAGITRIVTDFFSFFIKLYEGDFAGALYAVFDLLCSLIFTILKIGYDIIAAVVTYIYDGIVQNFGAAIDKVNQFFGNLLKTALDAISEIGRSLINLVTEKVDWAKGAIRDLFTFSDTAAMAAVNNTSKQVYNNQKNTFNISGSENVAAAVESTNSYFDPEMIE